MYIYQCTHTHTCIYLSTYLPIYLSTYLSISIYLIYISTKYAHSLFPTAQALHHILQPRQPPTGTVTRGRARAMPAMPCLPCCGTVCLGDMQKKETIMGKNMANSVHMGVFHKWGYPKMDGF